MCRLCEQNDFEVRGVETLNGRNRIFVGRTPCQDYYIEFTYITGIDEFLDTRDKIYRYQGDRATLSFIHSPDALAALLFTIKDLTKKPTLPNHPPP